jgi:hypothetical protein
MYRDVGWAAAALLLACQAPDRAEEKTQSSSAKLSGPAQDNESGQDPIADSLKHPSSPTWDQWDDRIIAPIWLGTNAKGTLYSPLWRGNSPAIEDFVPTPPGQDCSKLKGTIRIDWDQTANTVHFLIKYRGLMPHPVIHRTEGVDWFPNPFHNAPKDIEDGGYRLWSIFSRVNNVKVPVNFYYDPSTLQLLGSDYDFPNGPPSPVFLTLPTAVIIPSLLFHPDRAGFASHQWTTQYDHVKVEGGGFSHIAVGFVPHDLCEAAPLQPVISQLRPYVSPWQPPAAGPSWLEFLQGGLTFDTTIDTTTDLLPQGVAPYGYSGVAFISNSPFVQGGIPNGFSFDLPSAFVNVAPVFRVVPGGNGLNCQPFVYSPHVTAPRYCEMPH